MPARPSPRARSPARGRADARRSTAPPAVGDADDTRLYRRCCGQTRCRRPGPNLGSVSESSPVVSAARHHPRRVEQRQRRARLRAVAADLGDHPAAIRRQDRTTRSSRQRRPRRARCRCGSPSGTDDAIRCRRRHRRACLPSETQNAGVRPAPWNTVGTSVACVPDSFSVASVEGLRDEAIAPSSTAGDRRQTPRETASPGRR